MEGGRILLFLGYINWAPAYYKGKSKNTEHSFSDWNASFENWSGFIYFRKSICTLSEIWLLWSCFQLCFNPPLLKECKTGHFTQAAEIKCWEVYPILSIDMLVRIIVSGSIFNLVWTGDLCKLKVSAFRGISILLSFEM